MSSIPGPTSLRRSIMRIACSPAVLLGGFAALLIVTCPNARGVDALDVLIPNRGTIVDGSTNPLLLDVPASPTRPAHAKDRASARDRLPRSSVRSATLEERGAGSPGAGDVELFRYSRAAVPLLVEPLSVDASEGEPARIVPMTGPAVGVRAKAPPSARR